MRIVHSGEATFIEDRPSIEYKENFVSYTVMGTKTLLRVHICVEAVWRSGQAQSSREHNAEGSL